MAAASAGPATAGRLQPEANESEMAFIGFLLFFRIGTFQGVTGEKSKKF
jgi:hypothetical protein